MTVETFEEAKQLSIKKWRSILKKLEVVSCDTGEWCGFCLLADYTFLKNLNGNRCINCLVVNMCNEYKDNNMTYLQPYIDFVTELIEHLENIIDKNE